MYFPVIRMINECVRILWLVTGVLGCTFGISNLKTHGRRRGKGEILAFFYRGAVCGHGGDLSFVESVLRDQILGETLGHHPSKDGSGSGVSF